MKIDYEELRRMMIYELYELSWRRMIREVMIPAEQLYDYFDKICTNAEFYVFHMGYNVVRCKDDESKIG